MHRNQWVWQSIVLSAITLVIPVICNDISGFGQAHAKEERDVVIESTEEAVGSESSTSDLQTFNWVEEEGADVLNFGTRPVLRYIRPTLDNSSPEAREQTYKPFHHLYAPDGRQVTKGPGGRFTHHRGFFFGFNRITYGDGKKADVWHCRGNAFQSHEGTISQEGGPDLGHHTVRIDWHGEEGEVFAEETRKLTATVTPESQIYDFHAIVKTTGGPVMLDGDPQHAGVQFRADNQVADTTASQTIYIRPDGPGKPGATRNWEPKTGKGPIDLPWNAMSFVLDGTRYTAILLDHPSNPKPARHSERDYGRFGSYFEYNITEDQPLEVRYRLIVKVGTVTVEEVMAYDKVFDALPLSE